jgi:acetylornithine deacetylase/succinyl-diaminopimelate desuccinylase-like protein
MDAAVSAALDRSRRDARAHLAAVAELVRIPSVSTKPENAADVRRAATWLCTRLRATGMQASIVETARHPAVLAHWRRLRDRPTLLVYGHYDVQPAEPMEAWSSPPFAPQVRGSELYGRGASDDKGQLLAHVAALQSYLATTGGLPVNVVCLFEGEEEIGSPNLADLLRRHREALRADVAVLSDTSMPSPRQPAVTYGLRGLLTCEIEVCGAGHDGHSGTFGGAIANPLHGICRLVDSLHDGDGRIAVEGFDRRIRAVPPAERARLRRDGPDDAAILRDAGAEEAAGEPGWSAFERTVLRPSLSVTGIAGGFSGPGVKGVIPARAVAKLSLRLVPEQRPDEVAELLRAHLGRVELPAGLRCGMRVLAAAPAVVVDPEQPAMRAAGRACRQGFGRAPVFLRSGGTIPAVHLFREHLGIDTVLLGFGLREDRPHAPDERLHIPNFLRGVRTAIHLYGALAAAMPPSTLPRHRTTAVAAPAAPRRSALAAAGRHPWELLP